MLGNGVRRTVVSRWPGTPAHRHALHAYRNRARCMQRSRFHIRSEGADRWLARVANICQILTLISAIRGR
jgi:hypothetical protein